MIRLWVPSRRLNKSEERERERESEREKERERERERRDSGEDSVWGSN